MIKLLLLSGGASRRMGQDKSRLPLDDSDLLSFQQARFTAAGYEVVAELPDIYTGYLGPLAGIHSACVTLPEVSHWLVVPVDMPMVSEQTLHALVQAGLKCQRAVCYENCPLPLFLPNSTELVNVLERWLTDEQGKRSVYALMQALAGEWIPKPADIQQLLNINTPDQWQRYREGAELT